MKYLYYPGKPSTASVIPAMLLVILMLFVVGCDQRSKGDVVSVTTDWYEVISYDPPKRFYVTLRNVETGAVHHNVYVSKRCSGLPANLVGSRWEMKTWTYLGENGKYSEVVGANCQRFRTGAVYLVK